MPSLVDTRQLSRKSDDSDGLSWWRARDGKFVLPQSWGMVTASLTFTQNAISPGAGISMIGVGGLPVTLSNASNDGVARWIYELLDAPLDSALVPGILSSGTTPTATFTPDSSPDTPGCYKIRVTVVSASGDSSSQTRNFAVLTTRGWVLPAFQSNAIEMNFSGNAEGWETWLNRIFLDLSKIPVIPSILEDTSLTEAELRTELLTYLADVQEGTEKVSTNQYQWEPAASVVAAPYAGAVYSPTEDKIYLMPFGQCAELTWHRINCHLGTEEEYTVAGTVGSFVGGAYHPDVDRIYPAPFGQADEADWLFFNCSTGAPETFAHGSAAVDEAYAGAVYDPHLGRLYFVPHSQGPQANWHYVNGVGVVVAYAHGATVVDQGYYGGVYSPTQNRIYLVPYDQVAEANWHYIDCTTGNVVAYAHGQVIAAAAAGYVGGVYSPTQNRIYFIPYGVSDEAQWHYINCATGAVAAYTHGATVVASGYLGGAYMPTLNRIYMAPASQTAEDNWHYIDCEDGSVVAYDKGIPSDVASCQGACYSPCENRVYFGPFSDAMWVYVQDYSDKSASRNLMAGHLFNKF